MSMYTHTPGERIKLARLRLGLTQQELANALNNELTGEEVIERSLISRWEQDKNFPRRTRKLILQQILDIELGNPPLRRDTFSSYLTDRNEIEQSLLLGLQQCREVWLTNKAVARSIWYELDGITALLEKMRSDPGCYVREIYYIQKIEDLQFVKELVEKSYPNYELRIRVSPGHAFPVLLAPKARYGVILAGFFDDITSVGLELSGQVAGFNEHYMRLIWNKATPIFEDSTLNKDNLRKAKTVLKQLGGVVRNEFEARF